MKRARPVLLVALLLANVTALLVALVATTPTAHAAGPSLDIVVPKPAGGVASGPVGANISVSGSGTAGHTYQIGYVAKSDTCSSSNVQTVKTVTADSGGSFTATFAWPTSGTTRGAGYYICAQDQALLANTLSPPIQSAEVFKPLTNDGETPSISLQAVAPATPTAGTPLPEGNYYAASQVTITGQFFYPEHSTFEAFVTTGQSFQPSDLDNFRPLLTQGGGTTFQSQSQGIIVVTVTLPLSPRGQVYLHVISADVTKTFPPSVDASQQIILLAPQPTPTPASPTVSTTPSPSTTAGTGTGGGGGDGAGPNPSNVLAVIGLSGLSIILFVVGIILMTSASALPRTQR